MAAAVLRALGFIVVAATSVAALRLGEESEQSSNETSGAAPRKVRHGEGSKRGCGGLLGLNGQHCYQKYMGYKLVECLPPSIAVMPRVMCKQPGSRSTAGDSADAVCAELNGELVTPPIAGLTGGTTKKCCEFCAEKGQDVFNTMRGHHEVEEGKPRCMTEGEAARGLPNGEYRKKPGGCDGKED